MSLTSEQIGEIRQIARLDSFSVAQLLVSKLNAVEQAQAVRYINEWGSVERRFTIIKGNGVDIDKARYRLALINDVRRLLGLPELESEIVANASAEFCFSHPDPSGGFCGE